MILHNQDFDLYRCYRCACDAGYTLLTDGKSCKQNFVQPVTYPTRHEPVTYPTDNQLPTTNKPSQNHRINTWERPNRPENNDCPLDFNRLPETGECVHHRNNVKLDYISAREYCDQRGGVIYSTQHRNVIEQFFGTEQFWSFDSDKMLDCEVGNINGFLIEKNLDHWLAGNILYGLTNCAHIFSFVCRA